MTKIKLVIAIISGILISSCEKEIPFDGKISAPRLVLNAIVDLDSTFSIFLERSTFFLDNSSSTNLHITEGATVVVKNLSNNVSYTLTESTSGSRYDFPFLVTPNTAYSIEVNHPDFNPISSQMRTLSSVQILNLDTAIVQQNFESKLRFELTWNDNPSEDNFYFIHVIQNSAWDQGYFYPMFLETKDPAVDNSQNTDVDGSTYSTPYILITDATFNGGQKTLRFETYNPYYWSEEDIALRVELISMTKEVYLYRKSVGLHQNQDFFSEPVKVFSNILNGFGIFGFMSRDFRML